MEKLTTQLVIIGAGLAGLTAALTSQNTIEDIVLINKGEIFASGSTFLNRNKRWGITYAVNDEEKNILYDTIRKISKGTNTAHLSRILVEESSEAFRLLASWGTSFVRNPKGGINRIRPCFCGQPLAAIITSTEQFKHCLAKRLAGRKIRVHAQTAVKSLLVDHDRITGLVAQRAGQEIKISCRAVILACGGGAASFRHHIVDPGLTGDGYHLLANLGIQLHNMQYLQTVWEDVSPEARRFQLACLADGKHRFFDGNNNEIALPSVNSDLTRSRLGHVPISNLQPDSEFDAPLLSAARKSPIKVVQHSTRKVINTILPQIQACNGGVLITEHGETGANGLFAAGEITTGMHGGDRIGGMMMTNCLVYGRRAADAAVRYLS